MNNDDLHIERLSFRYPRGRLALKALDLTIPSGSRLAVIGPNGCGKTTLLRLIAGHLPHQEGQVRLGNRDLSGVRPQERPVATVFQDLGLFPNMTLQQNIAFGLRNKARAGREALNIASEWLKRFGLEELKEKYPGELSIGVQQRVALVRALALQPDILLLDEPTSSLDSFERQRLLRFLNDEKLQNWFRSIVLVTHDLDFAFAVCDRAAILCEGALVAQGAVRDLIEQSHDDWIVEYLQSYNRLEGDIEPGGIFRSRCGMVTIPLQPEHSSQSGPATVFIRPDRLSLTPLSGNGMRSLQALAIRLQYRCNGASLHCIVNDHSLRCDLLTRDIPELFQIGKLVVLYFDVSALILSAQAVGNYTSQARSGTQ
jgi:ABC-type Fe3+/spermidine/putrescine transport system ATPase subunit